MSQNSESYFSVSAKVLRSFATNRQNIAEKDGQKHVATKVTILSNTKNSLEVLSLSLSLFWHIYVKIFYRVRVARLELISSTGLERPDKSVTSKKKARSTARKSFPRIPPSYAFPTSHPLARVCPGNVYARCGPSEPACGSHFSSAPR